MKRAPDVLRITFHVGIEKRLADDSQGKSHHLLMQVDHAAAAPMLLMALGIIDHGASVGENTLAMKGRLNQPPLTQMEAVLAGEQSVAKNLARALHHAPLVMIARTVDEHVLRHLGMQENEDLSSERTVMNQISIFTM